MATSYPLHKIKVVLLENIHESAAASLRAAGYTVDHHDRAYQGDELVEVCGDAHVIGIRSKTRVTADFLQRAPRLWAVGCFCIGTNQVALDVAAGKGVPVFNAPFSNTRSVAEKTLAEIIVLHRRLAQRSAEMHQGLWRKSASGAHEIRGRVLGIVGYGRIGSQVSVIAEALGMRVLYYDVEEKLTLGNSTPVASLAELLAQSDVVTLHVPATQLTDRMVGAAELAQMKPGTYLINNARGSVVDVDALAAALRRGHIAGAAVDVFPTEPGANVDAGFSSPLQGLDNVVLTPHIGGSTIEAQAAIADSVSSRLVRLMNNGTTASAVNVPEVQLPLLHRECHRILHFHQNVPGVLKELHSRIAAREINIVAEYLQSDPKHAYAILDVATPWGTDRTQDAELQRELREVPNTIRVRTLW